MQSAQAATLEELRSWAGRTLAPTEWQTITQQHINAFANASGDNQWIHIDPERAACESPWGKTVAHGFLSLSLISAHWAQALAVSDARMGVNYGLNRARFPAPLTVGAKVRAVFTVADVQSIDNGLQLTVDAVIEIEGSEKPCCVAQWVSRKLR